MVDLLLSAGLLLAQVPMCGTFSSTPSSTGGCSMPAPSGGSYLLQELPGGQIWVQPPINQPTPFPYPTNTDNDDR